MNHDIGKGLSEAYKTLYSTVENADGESFVEVQDFVIEKGMSSSDMSSVLKGHKYSKKQLLDMSKKSTKEGRHGEADAFYKEFSKEEKTCAHNIEGEECPLHGKKKCPSEVKEAAVSKAQQRFMGMVYATKKGKAAPSPEVAAAAASMTKKDAKKFAGTKHDKLPEKKGRYREQYEVYKQELLEHHLEKYESWIESLHEQGYDISKWEMEELVDTYIKENNLWSSEQTIKEALKEGKGSPEALASLGKVKKRQEVLDAHEKKTGKKLDITKTPEHKAHKKNFPGAKRTGKKVKGAKETPSETHNRRVNKTVDRIVKRGYTSKEKKDNAAMAKHASRFD
jgi:hypothetical protein